MSNMTLPTDNSSLKEVEKKGKKIPKTRYYVIDFLKGKSICCDMKYIANVIFAH